MARSVVVVVLLGVAAGCAGCAAGSEPVPAPEVRVVVDATIPRGHPEGPSVALGGGRVTATGGAEPVHFAVETLTVSRLVATSATRLAGGRPVRWRIRTALATTAGDTAWRSVDDVLLRPDGPRELLEPTLVRAGADLLLARVELAPRDTTLLVGDSVAMRGAARDGAGLFLVDVALGWRSRDAAVATASDRGVVRALAPGRAWVVARGWNGVADSTTVAVVARP